MDLFATNFGTVDWAILLTYVCIPVVIGVLVRKYVHGIGDFIVAGRSLRLWLAVATMSGTEIGLVTVMYNAELGFRHGFSAFHIAALEFACILAIGLTGFIVYRLRQMEVMTIPEFYEKRFGRKVRVVGGIILALGGILNTGLFLKASARFMVGVAGYSDPAGLKIMMTVMLLMVLVYTVLGGMVSVVINDFVQFVFLSVGMLLGTWVVIQSIGWRMLFQAPATTNADAWFNPLHEGSGFGPLYVMFMTVQLLAAGALWQTGTQRALSAKSPRIAKQLYACSSISYAARRVIPMLWGIGACVFMANAPQFVAAFRGPNALSPELGMPLFLAKVVPSGLLGLLAAGMFAAFMSTQDSYLLSWSAVVTQDIIAPLRRRELSDRARLFITRVCIVSVGLFLLLWGLWFEAPVSLWNYMAITGTIYLAGAFTVIGAGLYWKRASTTGAYLALCAGVVAVLGIGPWTKGADVPWYLTDKFFGLLAFVLALVGMVVGSLLFPDRRKEVQA
ncbi:MAG: sodium:solute symporter family protein [Candidatus Oleimicrobiaceae bacterium]